MLQKQKYPSKAARPPGKIHPTQENNRQFGKAQHKAFQVVQQQLNEDEKLSAAVVGTYFADRKQGIRVQFPLRNRYIGVTDQILLVIEADFLGEPMLVERIERSEIKSAGLQERPIIDELTLHIRNGQAYHLEVTPRLRVDSRAIVQTVTT